VIDGPSMLGKRELDASRCSISGADNQYLHSWFFIKRW
jgi:hypothetical protein